MLYNDKRINQEKFHNIYAPKMQASKYINTAHMEETDRNTTIKDYHTTLINGHIFQTDSVKQKS